MKLTKMGRVSLVTLTVLAGMTSNSQGQLVDGQAIGVDFGPTAPTNNFNQRNDTGTTDALIDLTGVAVSNVTVTLSSVSGNPFSNNDADDTVGSPPAVYDSSNLTDWVGLVNNEGLVITIANLDDMLLYDLNIGHAFSNNTFTNGTTYSADGQSATNVDASVDPGFFDLTALATDGLGNIVITVTLPVVDGGDPEVPVVAALTLTANGVNSDSDGDGLSDAFEMANSALGYDFEVDNSADDFDVDDLTVAEELVAGTSVLLADTDGDGFNDGAEDGGGSFVSFDPATNTGMTGTNPLILDTDEDGLPDGDELNTGDFVDETNTGSDPNNPDTDDDGLSDSFEATNNAVGYDPNVDDSLSDFDDDDSTVAEELTRGTDVLDPDTDDDGFWDGAETNDDPNPGQFIFVSYDFSTNRGDTGTDPLLPDSDGDSLLDGEEPPFGADPNIQDTDSDGFSDDVEVQFETDPNDDQEFPVLPTVLPLSTFGAYFEVSSEDIRVNPDVIRAGGNGPELSDLQFVGLLVFDLDGVELTELQTETLTLEFALEAFDNTPVLDDLVVDYIGTFADNVLGGPGNLVNSADPNAVAMVAAPVVTNVFTGVPDLGLQTIDVAAIGSDSFTERYAVFRLTDPSLNDHEFNIPVTATLSIGPDLAGSSSDLVLCIEDDPVVAGNFLFSWNSEADATYDLRSSTDLTGDPATWAIVVPDIAADASGTNTESVTIPASPVTKTFYVVTEQ